MLRRFRGGISLGFAVLAAGRSNWLHNSPIRGFPDASFYCGAQAHVRIDRRCQGWPEDADDRVTDPSMMFEVGGLAQQSCQENRCPEDWTRWLQSTSGDDSSDGSANREPDQGVCRVNIRSEVLDGRSIR
jgi:hypothetical protein